MSVKGKTYYGALLVIVIGMLAACSSTVERVTDTSKLQEFVFLQPGVTSSKEVEARLGQPMNVYEEGRIVTYYFMHASGKYKAIAFSAECPDESCYHLVLVYRADGILDRWSMVYSEFEI